MKFSTFASLTQPQQYAMVLAMQVRNAMEDFHAEHLTDTQMNELNPIIRQALYDAVLMINDNKDPNSVKDFEFLVSMIPDDWEIPGSDEEMQSSTPS